jgi:hypothetical protein
MKSEYLLDLMRGARRAWMALLFGGVGARLEVVAGGGFDVKELYRRWEFPLVTIGSM